MNKKLVAVAVAGLLAAPLAAQAQTANVTLYGRLNLSLEAISGRQVDPNLPATAAPVNRTIYKVGSNSSRLGVRGTEALGGGLSVIFQIESSINGESGAGPAGVSGGSLAARDTFAGLQGPWGTAKVGFFLAPYDDITPLYGNVPTLLTGILSTGALWGQANLSKDNGGFDVRLPNSVRYDSPRIGGFVGSVQVAGYDTGSQTLAQQDRHAYVLSMGGFYANGPIQAGIAYESNTKVRGAGLNDYAFSIAGNYNFGIVKVGGVYERLDYDTATGSLERDFYGIGVTVPVGPGELYAFWGAANDGKGSAANGTTVGQLTKGGGTGASQWEISYTYALSKRTLTYVGFVQVLNDTNAAYNLNASPITPVRDANVSGFTAGFVHFF